MYQSVANPIVGQSLAFSFAALCNVTVLAFQHSCGEFRGISGVWFRNVADVFAVISERLPAYLGYLARSHASADGCFTELFRATSGFDVLMFAIPVAISAVFWRGEAQSMKTALPVAATLGLEIRRTVGIALILILIGIDFFGDYRSVFPESRLPHLDVGSKYYPFVHALLLVPTIVFAKTLILQTMRIAGRLNDAV